MKLKTVIRGWLVISCCHFGQADHGPGLDPDAILYRPEPIVNRLLKYLTFWQVPLTGLADREIHWPFACELRHPTWCYSANQICAFQTINIATLNTDRWVTQRQQRKITAHGLSELNDPPESLGFLVNTKSCSLMEGLSRNTWVQQLRMHNF